MIMAGLCQRLLLSILVLQVVGEARAVSKPNIIVAVADDVGDRAVAGTASLFFA